MYSEKSVVNGYFKKLALAKAIKESLYCSNQSSHTVKHPACISSLVASSLEWQVSLMAPVRHRVGSREWQPSVLLIIYNLIFPGTELYLCQQTVLIHVCHITQNCPGSDTRRFWKLYLTLINPETPNISEKSLHRLRKPNEAYWEDGLFPSFHPKALKLGIQENQLHIYPECACVCACACV